MSQDYRFPYPNPDPYIPATLSELNDQIIVMIFEAPTFIDRTGAFPERNVDSEFHVLVEGFGRVRRKLGDERYAKLVDLAAQAKALCAADPEDTNGKTNEARDLLMEIQDVLSEVRRRRVKARQPDEEGEITGD
jgi:hypothetical protein